MSDRMPSDLDGLTPDQVAARLLLQVDEADPVQAARLDAWLDQDPAHRQAWLDAQAVWASFDAADAHRPLDLPRRRAKALKAGRAPVQWIAAAACVAMALGVVLTPWRRATEAPAPVQHVIYEATGQQRLLTLPDGSKAVLAAGGALDLAYAGDARRARLIRGRAYFDVAHDGSRPFVVEAGGRLITVLGTRFDVASDAEGLSVTLLEGSVRVAAPGGDPVVLRPGQALVVAHGRTQVRQADEAATERWRETRAVFDDKPLSEAIVEMNRYSVLQLVIDDPQVAALRITGQFRVGDNARFARGLARLYPLRAVPDGPARLKLVSGRPLSSPDGSGARR
ncbi:FecR domain-containing protein [Caulobacter sp.]|uniref:FecR domain-containing protein n=1 Tax=Caulobacter sp. TaxID=78 RepID=UPI00161CBA00